MGARIDKFLWSMRIYKTRSLAADACKMGRIMAGGRTLKPSATVSVGDKINVRKGPITYSFEILQVVEHRLGAKLVPEYIRDITDPAELERLEIIRLSSSAAKRETNYREKNAGRPTKKDRREIMAFFEEEEEDDEL